MLCRGAQKYGIRPHLRLPWLSQTWLALGRRLATLGLTVEFALCLRPATIRQVDVNKRQHEPGGLAFIAFFFSSPAIASRVGMEMASRVVARGPRWFCHFPPVLVFLGVHLSASSSCIYLDRLLAVFIEFALVQNEMLMLREMFALNLRLHALIMAPLLSLTVSPPSRAIS